MPIAVSALWAYIQERSLDNAASGNFLTLATDGYPLLNRAYRMVAIKSSKRSTLEDATTLGSVITSATLGTQSRVFLTPRTITDVLEVFYAGTDQSSENASLTCSATNGTATMTTASDFLAASIEPGWRVNGTSVPTRTFVKSIESATSLTLSDKVTAGIVSASVSFRPVRGLPLQQEDYGQLLRLVEREARAGTPAVCGLRRAQSASVDSVGFAELLVYPIPDGATEGYTRVYFPMQVRYALTDLAAVTDVVDVEDGEDYLIGDIVAFWSCAMQGRGELAASLLGQLPEGYRDSAAQAAKTLPRKVPALAG